MPPPLSDQSSTCTRCVRGSMQDSNGIFRRCYYCNGTGQAPHDEPTTGDAHEKAIEAARARAGTNYGGARVCVAAYLSSMAEQGDPLVPASSLVEIARVAIPELNPDGVDQAAATMRLIAVEALAAAGVPLPVQRQSVAAEPEASS